MAPDGFRSEPHITVPQLTAPPIGVQVADIVKENERLKEQLAERDREIVRMSGMLELGHRWFEKFLRAMVNGDFEQ